MSKVPEWRFLQNALAQNGDKYVFAAETSPADRDPEEWDCSELIQWCMEFSAKQEGFSLSFADGSMNQRAHCKPISLQDAYQTRCALLFRDPSVTGIGHVAISMGDAKRTFEAMGSAYGTRFGSVSGRSWTSAGLIPELDYDANKKPEPRVERAVVFGRRGGRFGHVGVENLGDERGRDKLLRLLRRAEEETDAGVLVVRKEPKDLEIADEWPKWKAERRR